MPTCIRCGTTFPRREKRHGKRPYMGSYCDDHDAVARGHATDD